MKSTFLIRFGLAVVMFMHSVPSIVSGDVLAFGNEFLASKGFGIFSVPLAITIKLIHLFSIYALLANRFLKPIAILNIIILISGIIMIHGQEGWYVVGGGRNGIEFNFILIFVFLSFWFPDGLIKSEK
ncbi:DoxX family protein [Flavobacterium amniphilum]|uniref:DoxX family protein n=1 Tax=Flavobacterium amniphilum TaxID=1834035 RepID=UPI00202A2749|nr:DoxX family protein [Flavobacterium amniphilum]MCL9805527.1 DoxX family protein [Flavobacterium amniphilum]